MTTRITQATLESLRKDVSNAIEKLNQATRALAQAEEMELLPAGTEVIVRGRVVVVNDNDTVTPYGVKFAGQTCTHWVTYEAVRPLPQTEEK